MRDAFHDQLDSIVDDLVDICRTWSRPPCAWPPRRCSTGDAEIAEQVICRRRRDRRRPRAGRGAASFELLALQQPVASDLRMLVAALRMVSELERMGDLSVHVAKIARLRVPERRRARRAACRPSQRMADGRRGDGRAGSPDHRRPRRRGRARARGGRRGDGPAAPHRRSPSCSPTTGRTASSRPSTSPCSAATTSGSPTTPSRSPAASSSSSPARPATCTSERESVTNGRDPRDHDRLVTDYRGSAALVRDGRGGGLAASGSRYSPPGTVGRRSSSRR